MSRYFSCEKLILHPPPHHSSREVGVYSEGAHDFVLGRDHTTGIRITKNEVVSNLQLKQKDGERDYDLLTEVNIASKDDLVMGYASATKTSDTYAPGLTPQGIAGGARFLSESGLWGFPSQYTGVTTTSFKSLEDTPNDYTDQNNKYLKLIDSQIVFTNLADDISSLDISSLQTGVLHVTSDKNAKEDICGINLEHAVDMLRSIKPVSFKYKGETRSCIGVLAQEIQRVLPEAVSIGDEYLRVDYIQLVGLLTASQKGILERVDKLEARLSELMSNI